MYLAVIKCYAFCNLLHVMSCHIFVEINVIDFLFQEFRVGQLTGKVAIVCKQKHTCGIAVKASNRIYSLRTYVLNNVHHSLSLLWVIACCNAVFRLVKQYIYLFLKVHRSILVGYLVCTHNLGAKFCHHLSINLHKSCLYMLVSLTAAANTSICKEFVKAYRLVGIKVLFLVLNPLLHAVFSI